MAAVTDLLIPLPHNTPRLQLDTDDLVKRGLMIVISLYLIVALAAPLYVCYRKRSPLIVLT